MECTVPVEVHLATEHADVGSLELEEGPVRLGVQGKRKDLKAAYLELRAQLGAHYTDRDAIWSLVEPVIMRPLQREYAEMQSRDPDSSATPGGARRTASYRATP